MTASDDHLRSAWQDSEHAEHFDVRSSLSLSDLRRTYEGFNEFQLLLQHLPKARGREFIEVGCATGELYRYLHGFHPNLNYRGFDLSRPALDRARQKYPEGRFELCGPDLAEVAGLAPNILWCRDVAHHQPDPFAYFQRLLAIPTDFAIFRTRTRDVGPTERDPDRSCQWHYSEHWVPFIVMNTEELVESMAAMPTVTAIRILKRHEVLGGQHGRYLPKDCYDPRTGTAETAVLVELGPATGQRPVIDIGVRDDRPPMDALWRRAMRYARRRGMSSLR